MRATGNGYGNACTIAIEEPTAVHGICRIAYEITSNKGTIRVKIEWKWRLGGEVDSRSPSTDMEYLLNEFGVDRKAFPRKYCQLEHGRFRGGGGGGGALPELAAVDYPAGGHTYCFHVVRP